MSNPRTRGHRGEEVGTNSSVFSQEPISELSLAVSVSTASLT